MKSLISLNIAHSGCTQAISCHLNTLSPSLSAPAHTSHPCHHHISTSRHPIIHTFTIQMSKPPQSAPASPPQPCSEHLEDCTNPHCTFCPSTALTHPSPHHMLCSLQTADFQPSSPMFQSHKFNTLCISCPLSFAVYC